MMTHKLHGDVIAGMSVHLELDHDLVPADTEVPGCKPGSPTLELAPWRACDDYELHGDQADQLRHIAGRPDADVQRDVLKALLLDGVVPLTVSARIADGIVTLTSTVACEQEREDARPAALWVPGVAGIIDGHACLPQPRTRVAVKEEVAAELARTRVADVAELTVDQPGPGTAVLSGAVGTRSDRDLAIATARSVACVTALDDCLDVEC